MTRDTMCKFDRIVLVSESCKVAFDKCFPELSSKTCAISNILSYNLVNARAQEPIEFKVDTNKINLATTCRIVFYSKGLDRSIQVLSRLKSEGLLKNVTWYIIGDGPDMPKFKQLIAENGLQDIVIPLGNQNNPYPYLKQMSLFFFASRFEGKPMAVTEALMSGLPAIVTEYSSAREQVRDGIDGLVVENSETGIYNGLKYLFENPEIIKTWKDNVLNYDYSNVSDIKIIEQMFEENLV